MQQLSPTSTPIPADTTKLQRAPMYDLPSEFPREPGLPDVFHSLQPSLLSVSLKLTNYGTQNRFAGTDLNLYYDKEHRLWHKRPDWFLAVGVPLLYDGTDLRESYVAWDEKEVNPTVIIELLSPGTAQQDLGPFYRSGDEPSPDIEAVEEIDHYLQEEAGNGSGQSQKFSPPSKWKVYEEILKVPYYIVFDQKARRLWFFQWVDGKYRQQPLDPNNPRLWLDELEIGLALWEGEYCDVTLPWLRWFDSNNNWLPTPEEAERGAKLQERRAKQQALQELGQEKRRADEEQRLREVLLERLKQQGIEIDLDSL